MAEGLSAEQVVQEHGLDGEQTEALQQLVVTHLLKCSAAQLPKGVDDEDYQRKLEQLIEGASKPVAEAFEDYLRKELQQLESATA